MTKTQGVVENRPPTARPAAENLSEAIEQMMDRKAGERVRCVRVFGNCYRCNWWTSAKTASWLLSTTASIKRSIFLRATKEADKLVIDDLSKR